jgi:hypothetical protein
MENLAIVGNEKVQFLKQRDGEISTHSGSEYFVVENEPIYSLPE